MTEPATPLALFKKLGAARKAVEPVEKRGTNHEDGYAFVEAVSVVEEANRVLTNRGILILPSVESTEQTYGKSGVLVKAHMSFLVIDTASGESVERSWIGYGFDHPGDKAIYQAITGATKYFLAGLLAIPFVGSDPEQDPAPPAIGASLEAKCIRDRQDREAERPDVPPVEPSDLPPPDARGLVNA
jgi:hypothetical protein